MTQQWPFEIERTARATYWKLPNGTYVATSATVVLPPPITSGGYYNLSALKRLKGD